MVPGSVNAQKSHGFEASLLRKLINKFQQIRSVVKLAQVDAVCYSLTIGHYSHLQSTHKTCTCLPCECYATLKVFFLSLPSMCLSSAVPPVQSTEDVVGSGGLDMTNCSLYSTQRTSAVMEDVTYTHQAPQWEDFPVFLCGKLHQL